MRGERCCIWAGFRRNNKYVFTLLHVLRLVASASILDLTSEASWNCFITNLKSLRSSSVQFPNGNVLDHWLMVTPEEEALILRQFLRFGETRPIVELMTLQCLPAVNHPLSSELSPALKSCRSNISTFIEKNSRPPAMLRSTRGDSHLVPSLCHFKKTDGDDPLRHSGNFPGGRSLSLPCYFASSSFHCLVPSAEVTA